MATLRPLEPLHALRLEPFLKLLSTHTLAFNQRSRAFQFDLPIAQVMARVIRDGHLPLAAKLREARARFVHIHLGQPNPSISVSIAIADGSVHEIDAPAVSEGLNVAVLSGFLPEIAESLASAERYLAGMVKLVYLAPEQLINVNRGGIGLRVRTDTPRIDRALLSVLDRAITQCGVHIVVLRISRIDASGRRDEFVDGPSILYRSQPLRAYAISALTRFLSNQPLAGISTR